MQCRYDFLSVNELFSSFQIMHTGGEGKTEHEDKEKKRGRSRGKGRSKLEILTKGVAHPDTVRRRTMSFSTSEPSLKKKTQDSGRPTRQNDSTTPPADLPTTSLGRHAPP